VVASGSLQALDVEGVAGRPVSSIERDGLAAVTTELAEEKLRVRRRDLLRHLRVLEEAFERTTVVPCAFGTVLDSRQAVEEDFLDARQSELRALLERLEGRLQLNVTATYNEEAVLRAILAANPAIARLSAESRSLGDAGHFAAIRLGELVAAALGERRQADAQRLLDRLSAQADDFVAEEAPETTVLKAAFLVQRERAAAFDQALEALAEAEAPLLYFESIGPLPATAFARLEAA
jgi:Gas vesicle synthesis protein GvpL/GvpF